MTRREFAWRFREDKKYRYMIVFSCHKAGMAIDSETSFIYSGLELHALIEESLVTLEELYLISASNDRRSVFKMELIGEFWLKTARLNGQLTYHYSYLTKEGIQYDESELELNDKNLLEISLIKKW